MRVAKVVTLPKNLRSDYLKINLLYFSFVHVLNCDQTGIFVVLQVFCALFIKSVSYVIVLMYLWLPEHWLFSKLHVPLLSPIYKISDNCLDYLEHYVSSSFWLKTLDLGIKRFSFLFLWIYCLINHKLQSLCKWLS